MTNTEVERQQHDDWQISPLVPATGVVLLALFWLLSAFAGWAASAFCSDRGLGDACRAHIAVSLRPSTLVAALAAGLAAVALAAPVFVRSAAGARLVRLRLLFGSAACWLLALAVLFIAGEFASR
jgi:hypothetical protein